MWMNMNVIVIGDEMKEIKNQTHSCISHQMKVLSVELVISKQRQD